MSHHRDGHHDDVEHAEGGEREGFLDKVKDFFTGGDEREHQHEMAGEQDDLAEGQGETDSVASAGSGGLGESESGWDGSDEPPELTAPENEAVAAYSEASEGDGVAASPGAGVDETRPLDDAGNAAAADDSAASEEAASESPGDAQAAVDDEDYESRHGSGVDDAGVLADAPIEDEDGDDDGGEADAGEADAGEADGAAREDEERARREEEFAREHDPSTHDLEAGEEFRQRGDWIASEHDGPQVQEADGTVHDPEEGASDSSSGGGAGETYGQDDDGSGGGAMSGADDIRDGGHGWGSAAPMPGGGTPLGHPVKAWHDTMTFVLPGEDGYEGSDPHEWFVDGETAQRAGFRHAHGS